MGTLGRDELERRLGYHPAGAGTGPIFDLNRTAALVLAELWDAVLPASREAACAQTALQESLMWANAAVACNLDPNTATLVEVDLEDRLDALLDRLEGPELTRSGPDGGRSGGARLEALEHGWCDCPQADRLHRPADVRQCDAR